MSIIIIILLLGIMDQDNTLVIADFKNEGEISEWTVVDDGVMGG